MPGLFMERVSYQANKLSNSQYKFAGFGRRFLAAMIDGFILILLGIGISFSLGRNPFVTNDASIKSLTDCLISIIFGMIYTIGFWVKQNGQTPGKRVLHIRIIKEDGQPLDLFTAFIRYISQMLSMIVIYIGYIWVLFDSKKQSWHDKIARTYVIETDAEKPSKAVYALGCLIPILLMISFTSLVVLASMDKIGEKVNDRKTVISVNKAVQEMNPEAKKHYDRAQELFAQIKIAKNDKQKVNQLNDENIAEIKKAIEIEPENPKLWVDLGSAYSWVSTYGTLEDSLKAFEKASELEPDNFIYNNWVGDAQRRLGKYDEAILTYQKTIRKTGNSAFAYQGLGIAYFNLKIYDESRKNLDKALEIFEKENSSGGYDEAILETQKYIAKIPQK